MSRTIGRPRAQARFAAAALVASLAAAPLLGGCAGGGELTGSVGSQGLALAGGGSGSVLSSLVGQWFHLVYVPDSAGSVRTSETTLDLRGDGTLVRSVVTRSLSFGFADQVVSTGTWRATATTLTIAITTTGGTATPAGGLDTATTSSGLPALTPNPPFGTTPSAPADTVGTGAGTTTYTYRVETTTQGTVLFLNQTPFVRLVNAQ